MSRTRWRKTWHWVEPRMVRRTWAPYLYTHTSESRAKACNSLKSQDNVCMGCKHKTSAFHHSIQNVVHGGLRFSNFFFFENPLVSVSPPCLTDYVRCDSRGNQEQLSRMNHLLAMERGLDKCARCSLGKGSERSTLFEDRFLARATC